MHADTCNDGIIYPQVYILYIFCLELYIICEFLKAKIICEFSDADIVIKLLN